MNKHKPTTAAAAAAEMVIDGHGSSSLREAAFFAAAAAEMVIDGHSGIRLATRRAWAAAAAAEMVIDGHSVTPSMAMPEPPPLPLLRW